MLLTSRTLLLAVFVALASPSTAAVFVVESTADTEDADPGDGACRDAADVCTLRAAIAQANASAGADTIQFAIPGAGPHTIQPGAGQPLPPIAGDLVLDGYSQPGASVNTHPFGTDAVIQIVIDGAGRPYETGLLVESGRVGLRGIAVHGFSNGIVWSDVLSGSQLVGSRIESCDSVGVWVLGGAVRIGGTSDADRNQISGNASGVVLSGSGAFVTNNLIGTDASGSAAMGNGVGVGDELGASNVISDNVISGNNVGVYLGSAGSASGYILVRNLIGLSADGLTRLGNLTGIRVRGTGNQIGVPGGASRTNANVISANGVGLELSGDDNSVKANYFGTGLGGSGAYGNDEAIVVNGAGNVIGAAVGALSNHDGNVIAFSTREGIGVYDGYPLRVGNALRENRIFGNARGEIDLRVDGFFSNDLGDLDEGPNRRQNSPVIDAVSVAQGVTQIDGKLDTLAGAYTLDFYSSVVCDAPPDTGSAQYFLGSRDLLAAAGETPFSFTFQTTALGRGFSAMATDADGNSSEVGPCFTTALSGGADLALDVVIDSDQREVDPGEAAHFEVTLHNAGPATATNVPVSVPLPPGFASWSSTGPGSYDTGTGIWSAGNLTPGTTLTRVFDAVIDAGAAGPVSVEASADQDLSQPDPDLVNNRSSAAFDVRAGADLVVTQSAPISTQPGDAFVLDVSVRNDGPETATEVLLSGVLDAGLELDPAGSLPAGFSYDATSRRWSAPAGELAEGATAEIALPLRVALETPIGVGLKSTSSAAASTPRDPSPAASSILVGSGVVADLALEATQHERVGSTAQYTFAFEVQNLGPDEAPSLIVTFGCQDDPSSSDLRVFEPVGAACGYNSDCFVCTFGPLAPGATFEVKANGPARTRQVRISSDPNAPLLDPQPINNRYTFVQDPSTCGLLGIEAPLFLGLIVLLRGRRGRAALRRLLPGSALVLTALLGAPALPADATPLAFQVDAAASHATVSVASNLGSPPPAPLNLAGSVNAEVTLDFDPRFGLTATSLQLTGGTLAFSDASLLLSSFPLYDLVFASHGVGADLSGPATSGFAAGPGLTVFDLFGAVLVFDTGTIDATGSFFGAPVSETLDLSLVPFRSTFPLGSVAMLEGVDLGGGVTALRLTTPFSAVLRMSIESEPVTVTIAGTLALTGSTTVPEPGTASLLGAGLLGLSLWRARKATPER